MELIFGHTHTRTDGRTDGWTDKRGSRNSYLDVVNHLIIYCLKYEKFQNFFCKFEEIFFFLIQKKSPTKNLKTNGNFKSIEKHHNFKVGF